MSVPSPSVAIFIPARLGSTRLPGKPLLDIAGKPMIAHVVASAQASQMGVVHVACDDELIAQAVENEGAQAIMTHAGHASGSDRIFEAMQVVQCSSDIIINLQGDLPTVSAQAIREVCLPLLQDTRVDIATLVAVIRDQEELMDPSVVKMVGSTALSGTLQWMRALYFTRATAPYGVGEHYHHIGIYAYRRAALERFVQLPPSHLEVREKLEQLRALEAGMYIAATLTEAVPLGVDTQQQLEKVRQLLAASFMRK